MHIEYHVNRLNIYHFKRHQCRICEKSFKIGDKIIKRSFRRLSHKKCFDKSVNDYDFDKKVNGFDT